MEKTPISRLQEICAHNGLTPEYQLLSVEGKVHQPTFIFRVQVGEITATATGQSKKKAKHAVAKRAIEMIIDDSEYQVENAELILEQLNLEQIENETENTFEKCEDEEEGGDTNPVGKLQEICMKRHWRPPQYETISEEGLPHERTFKMKCIIDNINFNETGIGKSKRLAKRKAAQMMIKRLKDENLADSDDISEKLQEKKDSDWIQSKSSGKVIPALQKIDNFYHRFNEELKDKIEDIIENSVDTKIFDEMGLKQESDYLTDLAKLTKTIDCTFKVVTVPQLSNNDNYQCMVHIIPNDITYTELPVLTGWGAAEQLSDAKETAAGSAIKLLSLMRIKKDSKDNLL